MQDLCGKVINPLISRELNIGRVDLINNSIREEMKDERFLKHFGGTKKSNSFNTGVDDSNSDVAKCGNYSFNDAENIGEHLKRHGRLISCMIYSNPNDSTSNVQPQNLTDVKNSVFENGTKPISKNTLSYMFSYEKEENHLPVNDKKETIIQNPAIHQIKKNKRIPFGMILPIDDNEYAILNSIESDHEISYEVYSPNDNSTEFLNDVSMTNMNSYEGSTRANYRKSFSFTRTDEDPTLEHIVYNFDNLPPVIKSSTDTPPWSTPHPKEDGIFEPHRRNHGSLCVNSTNSAFDQMNSEQIDTILESSMIHSKDKSNIPLFDTNGLFMKKDHPIFMQNFSRKVFIGGLPRHITIEEIEKQFALFGSAWIDWPNRDEEIVPPHGFAFLHFDSANSVNKLYDAVFKSKTRNKYCLSSQFVKSKEVEIKFWKMSDSEILFVGKNSINARYTVFVGALPRICTARELAAFMDRRFSNVVYAAIDVDLVYGYPKGAGRVTFRTLDAYKNALSSHYIDMDIGFNGCKRKKIEIKPFLLSDQKCDLCSNIRPTQAANKYCYRCSFYICDQCEISQSCIDSHPHNVIGRNPEPSPAYSDIN